MSQYINLKSILNAALGNYQNKGFRLEDEVVFVTLFYKDKQVDTFPFKELTIIRLHKACEKYLKEVKVND